MGLRSDFYGSVGKNFLYTVGCFILSLTVIFSPLAYCIKKRWITENTRIVGMKLEFTGKALQLFGLMLKWLLLSIVTLTIYGIFFVPVRFRQWQTQHTVFAPVDMVRTIPGNNGYQKTPAPMR